VATLEGQTEKLRATNAQLRHQTQEIKARERLAEKLMDKLPRGSMTSDLYNQEFPAASKYQGALSLYRSHWQGSNDHLRRLSRIAVFESPTAEAMIGGLTDVVVGGGLRLQAEPMWDIIRADMPGMSAATDTEEQRLWRLNVEHRYRLWWKTSAPSYNREYNGFEIDQQAFRYLLQDGEFFVVFRYSSSRRGSPLTLQFIPPEDVQGGITPNNGNTIENGIEYNQAGAAVAYHVLNQGTGETKRIPRWSRDRARVIHMYLKTSEKQRRGVPYLSSVIHELTKIGDYEVLELQAAVINALFAVWVRPPEDMDGEPTIGGGATKKSSGGIDEIGDDPTMDYVARSQKLDFSHGGVILDQLPAGHSVESFDTKRPNQGFDKFLTAVKRNIAASKRLPLAVVDLQFNNSYSGARGELLMFWMSVDKYRQNHGLKFHDMIYQMWMWCEIDRGRIEAPGFEADETLREAYSNSQWIGNQRPDIDPLKSVSANILEQKYAYSTGHKITSERGGGDYQENLTIIKKEFEKLAEAIAPMQPDSADALPTNSRAPEEPE